jgi:hypothetical protein
MKIRPSIFEFHVDRHMVKRIGEMLQLLVVNARKNQLTE